MHLSDRHINNINKTIRRRKNQGGMDMKRFELPAIGDARKSFYNKAIVTEYDRINELHYNRLPNSKWQI